MNPEMWCTEKDTRIIVGTLEPKMHNLFHLWENVAQMQIGRLSTKQFVIFFKNVKIMKHQERLKNYDGLEKTKGKWQLMQCGILGRSLELKKNPSGKIGILSKSCTLVSNTVPALISCSFIVMRFCKKWTLGKRSWGVSENSFYYFWNLSMHLKLVQIKS